MECVPTNRERASVPENLDIKEKTVKVVTEVATATRSCFST